MRITVRVFGVVLALGLLLAAVPVSAHHSGPPTNLLRNGITKFSLPTGTEIKLFGYQAKSGEPKGVGVFVEYLDGRKVFMGGSAPGADGNSPAKK
jgi:hypothetical protein